MTGLAPIPRLSEVLEQYRRCERTPSDVVEECLARIEALEPQLKAWVLLDATAARREAAEHTRDYERGVPRGPLAGIPVGIKDIIDVAGWPTKAGSSLREQHLAERDAPVVAALRRAGAILMGKTVTTQFACFDPAATRNPHHLDHSPGGSSSGSAAAVASGMCFAALATQTGGSITRPAAYCGIAGLKPTFGSLSMQGIVPVSPRLDHVGVVARSAADVELVWNAIHTSVAEEEIPRPPQRGRLPDGTATPKCSHVDEWLLAPFQKETESVSVAVLNPPFRILALVDAIVRDTDREIAAGVQEVCQQLEAAGGDVYFGDGSPFAHTLLHIGKLTWEYHRKIMAHDAWQFHASSFRSHPEAYLPGLVKLFAEGELVSEEEYDYCLCFRESTRQDIDRTLHWVDAILTPATPNFAPPLSANSTGDPRWNSPFSLSGHPTMSCPVGRSSGNLPWGVQLVGPYHSENRLIQIAKWIESVVSYS